MGRLRDGTEAQARARNVARVAATGTLRQCQTADKSDKWPLRTGADSPVMLAQEPLQAMPPACSAAGLPDADPRKDGSRLWRSAVLDRQVTCSQSEAASGPQIHKGV